MNQSIQGHTVMSKPLEKGRDEAAPWLNSAYHPLSLTPRPAPHRIATRPTRFPDFTSCNQLLADALVFCNNGGG
jgi:hypothetical protein